jgi:hypothetical protein
MQLTVLIGNILCHKFQVNAIMNKFYLRNRNDPKKKNEMFYAIEWY